LVHTCFLSDIQRKQQLQGRKVPLWVAPSGRAEGAPLLFSLYITQETGIHQTWYARQNQLPWKVILLVLVQICWSLIGN
jgi:hypothetical protein